MRNRLLLMARKRLVPGYSALYLFNEGGGQVLTDYSGNGNHGTLGSTAGDDTNDPAWGATGLTFAADDYVNCGSAARLFAAANLPFTAQVVASRATTDAGVIIGRAGATIDNRTFQLGYFSGVYVVLRGAGIPSPPTLSSAPHVLTVTWDGAAANLVIDTTAPAALPVGTAGEELSESVLVGARTTASPTTFWKGPIYAIAIYPFALTAAQIAQNYAYFKALLAPRGVTLA